MLELSVAVDVLIALDRLLWRLQAVALLPEQRGDCPGPYPMSKRTELLREFGETFRCPAQWRLRIAARHRINQRFQMREQCRVFVNQPLASSSWAPGPLVQRSLLGRRSLQSRQI